MPAVAVLPRCKQCKGDLVMTDVFRCGMCGVPYLVNGKPLSLAQAHGEEPFLRDDLEPDPDMIPPHMRHIMQGGEPASQEELQALNPLPEKEVASPADLISAEPAKPVVDLTPVPEKPLFRVDKKNRLITE